MNCRNCLVDGKDDVAVVEDDDEDAASGKLSFITTSNARVNHAGR